MRHVSEAEIETWRRDGVVCLRGAFAPDWIAGLADGIEAAMAAPGPLAKEYGKADAGRFFTDYNMWRRIEAFRRFTFGSPAARLAAELMGSPRIDLYGEHLLVKEPGSGESETPWHQDLPYWRIDGAKLCSLWLALDPVTEETGAMRFVRGSHHWAKAFRPVRFQTGEEAGADDFDGDMPDIDADPDRFETVCYEMEPGDCTIHHALTIHASGGNSAADQRRRALALRFAGAGTSWRNRAFSPMEYESDLEDGEPITLAPDLFPPLWPQP